MRVGYLVHDLSDAAVARRIHMLKAAGLEVTLAGFARAAPPTAVGSVPARCLGRTRDGRLVDRALAVLRALPHVRAAVRDADVLVARNLEMLALAVVARAGRRVVYECLDIHRTLTGRGRAARLVQFVERLLLRRVALVLTSSPRFVSEHFALAAPNVPTMVFENKVLALGEEAPSLQQHRHRPAGAPWTIGWFGMLRCRRSFAMLKEIAAASAGRIEVLIAGKPSPAEFADFEGAVAIAPGVRFTGAYTAADLPALYEAVDFAWAIDYFEEGENSTWLLPNRLYEASAHGAVPIALAEVETGAWLCRHGAGLLVTDPQAEVAMRLGTMGEEDYAALRARMLTIQPTDLIVDKADVVALALAITG